MDTLPARSTNGVDRMYHQLKDILGIAIEQQVESSLQRWVEDSISSPSHSKASRQRTTMELPVAGTVSLPVWALTHLLSGHPSGRLERPACYQAHWGHVPSIT
jgi:hypothetical protein